MVLFKNVSGKPKAQSVFPQPIKASSAKTKPGESSVIPEAIAKLLMENTEFIDRISEAITSRVLTTLCEQYDFTPTNKYLEEVSNRQKYIGQLDSYIKERREINNAVDNELQVFLQETSSSLAKALDTFTASIAKRIKQAETKHGIDNIKKSLLSTGGNENWTK